MKRLFLFVLLMALGAAAGRWGPMVFVYVVMPPEHGVFRYHQNLDHSLGSLYWEYWRFSGDRLASGDYREGVFREDWEFVRGRGGEHYLYDYRGEFDRVVTFSRTEMIMRGQDGREERFARVLDPWEIWREEMRAKKNSEEIVGLERWKQPYEELIAQRMAEHGVTVRPGVVLRQRPPARVPPRAEPAATPAPLLVVTEYGYGNSTGPTFVVYADGLVICRALPEHRDKPLRRLDVPDVKDLVARLTPENFATLAPRLRLSDSTDQDTTRLWIAGRTVEVYGPWRKPWWQTIDPSEKTEFTRELETRWAQLMAEFPTTLLESLRKIDRLREQATEPWWPAKVEVTFSGLQMSRQNTVPWPAKWPGIYDPTSIKESAFSYRVFVPAGDWLELCAFVESLRPRTVVLVDLNQMSPHLRLPLPNEEAWRQR